MACRSVVDGHSYVQATITKAAPSGAFSELYPETVLLVDTMALSKA